MKAPVISFVLPVYNVGPYLRRCFDSILQSVGAHADRCEVVVADDGSTDDSAAIIDEYAAAYPALFRPFHKQNEGVSRTRNFGLDHATGQYIWFVDPDDKVEPAAVSEILDALERLDRPQIVQMAYRRFNDRETFELQNTATKEEVLDGAAYMDAYTPNPYLWSKLMSRAFLNAHNLRFTPGLNTQEDWLLSYYAYCRADRIACTNIHAYDYFLGNPTSILRNPSAASRRRSIADSLAVGKEFHAFAATQADRPYYAALRSQESIFTAGFLYSLFTMKLPAGEVKQVLKKSREIGIYPAPYGRNKRGNKFLRFANRSWIFLPVCWLHSLRGKLPKA